MADSQVGKSEQLKDNGSPSPKSHLESGDEYEVDKIIGVCKTKGKTMYKVRWVGFDPSWDTWEPAENLESCIDVIQAFLQQKKEEKTKPTKPKKVSVTKTLDKEVFSQEESSQDGSVASSNASSSSDKKKQKPAWKYVSSSDDEADTLKDKFWRDLEQGKVNVFQNDMYSKVKGEGSRPSRPESFKEMYKTKPLVQKEDGSETVMKKRLSSGNRKSTESSSSQDSCRKSPVEIRKKESSAAKPSVRREVPGVGSDTGSETARSRDNKGKTSSSTSSPEGNKKTSKVRKKEKKEARKKEIKAKVSKKANTSNIRSSSSSEIDKTEIKKEVVMEYEDNMPSLTSMVEIKKEPEDIGYKTSANSDQSQSASSSPRLLPSGNPDTLKDTFWRDLEEGKVNVFSADMYSKVKSSGRAARPKSFSDQPPKEKPPKEKKNSVVPNWKDKQEVKPTKTRISSELKKNLSKKVDRSHGMARAYTKPLSSLPVSPSDEVVMENRLSSDSSASTPVSDQSDPQMADLIGRRKESIESTISSIDSGPPPLSPQTQDNNETVKETSKSPKRKNIETTKNAGGRSAGDLSNSKRASKDNKLQAEMKTSPVTKKGKRKHSGGAGNDGIDDTASPPGKKGRLTEVKSKTNSTVNSSSGGSGVVVVENITNISTQNEVRKENAEAFVHMDDNNKEDSDDDLVFGLQKPAPQDIATLSPPSETSKVDQQLANLPFYSGPLSSSASSSTSAVPGPVRTELSSASHTRAADSSAHVSRAELSLAVSHSSHIDEVPLGSPQTGPHSNYSVQSCDSGVDISHERSFGGGGGGGLNTSLESGREPGESGGIGDNKKLSGRTTSDQGTSDKQLDFIDFDFELDPSLQQNVKPSTPLEQMADMNTGEFRHAIKKNEFDKVRLALSRRKYDLEQADCNGVTLTMYCAMRGFDDMLELLVKNGANVNAETKNGSTALIIACEQGLRCTVELLLSLGAFVNKATSTSGETALIKSVKRGHLHIVRSLLDQGCNFSSPLSEHNAVKFAKAYNQPEIMNLLNDHVHRVTTEMESQVLVTLNNTARIVNQLFGLQCLALREGGKFKVTFKHELQPTQQGMGMLLFIAHARVSTTEVKCRFYGPCAVTSAQLNGTKLHPLTDDGNFVMSFCPLHNGKNELEINTVAAPTSKAKLVVCAYKAQLSSPTP